MASKTSPVILAALFQRFQARSKAEIGVNISMRRTSEDLLVKERLRRSKRAAGASGAPDDTAANRKPDANALGRWTNPGEKENWYIPISRVTEVAGLLGASQDDVDELMIVRLEELASAYPEHDAVVTAAWACDYALRARALNEDEQALLDAFRHSCTRTSYRVLDATGREKAQAFFDNLIQEHLNGLAEDSEPDAYDVALDALTPDEQAAARKALSNRALAVVPKKVQSVPKPGRLESAEVVARRFLKALNKGFKGPAPAA